MRLVYDTGSTGDLEQWVAALRRNGLSAGHVPLQPSASDVEVAALVGIAAAHDIILAEVGAWSNPLSRDAGQARSAILNCQRRLDLAERTGARCCVNIAGSRHLTAWDGPHPDNFSADTFGMIVEITREIIDAVKPRRTFYTLETMPWIFPSTADEYLRLIRAIDRPAFAVHLDPVNMITSPAICTNGDSCETAA